MEKYLNEDTKTFLDDKQPQAPIIRTKAHRSSELRDRLRTRLLKRREKRIEKQKAGTTQNASSSSVKAKFESRVPLPTNMPPPESALGEVNTTANEMTDIRGLVNYIEGNCISSKAELAQKKAAKKNRQKEKREQERLEAELEAKRKEEEEKRKELERLKELERQEKLKQQHEKQLKKKLKKQRQLAKKLEEVEETIPAMVTIKRVPNSETGSPSVTITLKGYTPDQDKLLYTLVDKPEEKENTPLLENSNNLEIPESNKAKKKKKKEKDISNIPPQQPKKESQVLTKEVKVTLAVDKNPNIVPPEPLVSVADSKKNRKAYACCNHENDELGEEIRTFGNLRLPPGITITKVQNPSVNKKYLGSESHIKNQQGVIVVETEKLIKKNDSSESDNNKSTKKNKKKKNKKTESNESSLPSNTSKMVTLKNPMFQQYTQALNKPDPMGSESIGAASIITNENGMVTIRSSRLQQSLDQGIPAKPLGFPIPMPIQEIVSIPLATSPVIEELPSSSIQETEASSKIKECPYKTEPVVDIINGISSLSIDNLSSPKSTSPEPIITKSTNEEDMIQDTLDAQQILSGLPGIEITKIDKYAKKEEEKVPEEAQVTIISSSGNEFDFDFAKDDDDDWIYESVFKPRDVLEDELDDDELEIEEFKRFCQQSVPPKCKEKVSLNVADIVLKKKTDVKLSLSQ